MRHRLLDLREAVVGTLFAVNDQIWNGSDVEERADIWHVPLGAPSGSGVGSCERITAANLAVFGAGAEFYWNAIPNPSRERFLCLFGDDDAIDRHLRVLNVDGSGEVTVNADVSSEPVWVGDSLIAYSGTEPGARTTFDVAAADGSGVIATITRDNIHGWDGSPDGTLIAYAATTGADIRLHVCDPDGANDTVIVASGLAPGTVPVWTLDSTQIVYRKSGGTYIVNADGSGETQIVSSGGPSGFWYPQAAMGSDRVFYSDTSAFSNWRLAQFDLVGSGASIISPNRRLSQAVQRGVCVWDVLQERVFSVLHGAVSASGRDEIFSTLADGSDFRTHFEAEEDPGSTVGDNFQNLSYR